MKPSIKCILATSALAATGAANATTWNLNMTATNYFAGLGGNMIMTGIAAEGTSTFVGSWNDVSGAGFWRGRIYSAGSVGLDVNINQTFNMPITTSTSSYGDPTQGTLNPFNIPSCHDNLTGQDGAASSACAGFSAPLSGPLFNTVGTTATNHQTPLAFTPTDGTTYDWTLQVYKAVGTKVQYLPVPMQVTLHSAGVVPVPAVAWLFGSALVGVGATARRRRTAAAA